MSILEKIGINNELVNELKREGLFVPRRIKPFRRVFKTPGGRWVYYSADRFTPPLTEEERQHYIKNPNLFCRDFIEKLLFFSKVSGILFEAVMRIDKYMDDEEALAAYLVVLYLFHVCGDYNYYKYDGHLEYHEHKESPVGWYYQKLKKLCLRAARRKGVQNHEEWAIEKMLAAISTPFDDRIGMSIKYLLSCQKMHKEILELLPDFDKYSIQDLLNEIQVRDSQLYRKIEEESKSFFKNPGEFIADCIKEIDFDVGMEIKMSKKSARKARDEILNGLEGKEKKEFNKIVETVHEFLLTQQKEVFIATGRTASGNCLPDPFFIAYQKIKEMADKHPRFINKKYIGEMQQILKEENPVVGARRIVVKADSLFKGKIRRLYLEELERWL